MPLFSIVIDSSPLDNIEDMADFQAS